MGTDKCHNAKKPNNSITIDDRSAPTISLLIVIAQTKDRIEAVENKTNVEFFEQQIIAGESYITLPVFAATYDRCC